MIKIRRWLDIGLILILGTCLLPGCGQKSEKVEVRSIKLKDEKVALDQRKSEKKVPKSTKEQIKLERAEEELQKEAKKRIKKMEWICRLTPDDTASIEAAAFLISGGVMWLEKEGGKQVIPIVVDVIKNKKRDWTLRFFLVEIIIRMGIKYDDKSIVKPLIEVIKDKSDRKEVRDRILGCIGELRDRRAVEPLLRVIEEESDLKQEALRSLGPSLGEPKNIEGEKNKEIRRKVRDLMIKMVEEESEFLQSWALATLLDIGEIDKVLELGIKLLKEPKKCIRICDVPIYLGRTKDKRAIEPLIEALLGKQETDVGGMFKIRGNIWAAYGLNLLWCDGIKDDRIIEALIKALEYGEDLMVWKAAKALGEIKDKRAVEPLIKALKKSVKEGIYPDMAILDALGEIGDERAVEPLMEILKKGNLRLTDKRSIEVALEKLTGKDSKYFYKD